MRFVLHSLYLYVHILLTGFLSQIIYTQTKISLVAGRNIVPPENSSCFKWKRGIRKLIEVKNLCKNYDGHPAITDLTFTIEKGHIYGFLGPNAAGKSTTMNIITGCLAASSGEVYVGGYDIFEQPKEAKKLIGYLPEIPPLYIDQTVEEYLFFVAEAKGFKKDAAFAEIDRVILETHIEDVAERLIKHLSKGYRQRVGIAQALIGNPEVIILDEPTVGLDPKQIIEIRDLIRELGQSHTVILSSHILSEVQAICDEVLIISKGRLVLFDKIENLGTSLSTGNTIEISAELGKNDLQALLSGIADISHITVSDEKDGVCSAVLNIGQADPKSVCREVFLAFSSAGKVLLRLNPVEVRLEDIFIELTGDSPESAAEKEDKEEETA